MPNIPRQPDAVFPPYRGYVHAMEVPTGSRLLFISGLRTYLVDPSYDEANVRMAEYVKRTTLRLLYIRLGARSYSEYS